MIRVTAWYEMTQEAGRYPEEIEKQVWAGRTEEEKQASREYMRKGAEEIRKAYPKGLMNTLADNLRVNPDMEVKVVDLFMPACGLTDELLENTDVLIWWAHISHRMVPDELVQKIKERVYKGMGLILLHSAHFSKLTQQILGCSGTLSWREGDFCRVWNINPSHPIAQGIPEYVELEEEEMYGEPFDIAPPDEQVFISWFRGGEVFRSGCTWHRGNGRIFYFQPGHETNPTYHNPHICQIIANAVRWAQPRVWREELTCPNPVCSPEQQWRDRQKA